ncbi:MAG: hypothetical protein BWY31_04519 [Lentisphaerae bacterium ADurb.Bin242]|nr:MAG: hypothetical protein BWY31_04519 [Lentisphaerae bacterium ADurb.Bin242]
MVVEPEPDGGSRGTGPEAGHEILFVDDRRGREKDERDRPGPARQSVHVVEEVDGVEDEHDPEDGDAPGDPRDVDEEGYLHAAESDCDRGDQDLPDQFVARGEREFVIQRSQKQRRRRAAEDHDEAPGNIRNPGNAVQKRFRGDVRKKAECGDQPRAERDGPCEEHGKTPEERSRFFMELVIFTFRNIEKTGLSRQRLAERRQSEGQSQGHDENSAVNLCPVQEFPPFFDDSAGFFQHFTIYY